MFSGFELMVVGMLEKWHLVVYFSLKVEYDKLANEKTEMQRHYVMVRLPFKMGSNYSAKFQGLLKIQLGVEWHSLLWSTVRWLGQAVTGTGRRKPRGGWLQLVVMEALFLKGRRAGSSGPRLHYSPTLISGGWLRRCPPCVLIWLFS